MHRFLFPLADQSICDKPPVETIIKNNAEKGNVEAG